MKLYIKIDYKDRYEISGTIKNKTRKVEEEIFLFYKATRLDFVEFYLEFWDGYSQLNYKRSSYERKRNTK